MSWETYIESFDKGPGALYSGLFGFDGSPWAVSKGFSPARTEVSLLARLVQGEELKENESIMVSGRRYTMYKLDDGKLCVLSKDKKDGEMNTACLVCLLTTGVVVSVVEAPMLQQACNYLDFYHNFLKQY